MQIKNIYLYANSKIQTTKNIVNTSYPIDDNCVQKEKFSKLTAKKLRPGNMIFHT